MKERQVNSDAQESKQGWPSSSTCSRLDGAKGSRQEWKGWSKTPWTKPPSWWYSNIFGSWISHFCPICVLSHSSLRISSSSFPLLLRGLHGFRVEDSAWKFWSIEVPIAEESKEKEQWQSEPLLRLMPKLGQQPGQDFVPTWRSAQPIYKCQGSMMDLSLRQKSLWDFFLSRVSTTE